MLSPQNPPPDPSCHLHEISQQLKTSDERASSSDKAALQEEVEVVDLVNKSGSDDNNPPHQFSIRGYVFDARIKDIETNWPFSRKSLQLCQKHGVKNLLPPFQSLDSVSIPCSRRCEVETISVEAEDIKVSKEVPSTPNDQLISVASGNNSGCGKKLPLDCVNIGKASPTKQLNQISMKKCKLIIKVGGTDPSANGDSMVNFAETSMASKVCPVCKNFSSSSNTTLNAHIDQCLSVESPSNVLNANARVIRHRVKPRKNKLMVDIYKTAPHCTLEELDLRNGTSWAVNSNKPSQETKFPEEVEEQKEDPDEEDLDEEQKEDADEEEQKEDADDEELEDEVEPRVSSVNFSSKGSEGAVYIDANGTKVRILSKFNDVSPSVPKLKEDHGHLKLGKGSGRKKFMSISSKKHHMKKRHKYLNLSLDARSKKKFSPMSQRTFEVDEVQERNVSPKENSWKEQSMVQPIRCQEKTKADDSGPITKWASSKRRVLLRKRSCKQGLLHLASNFGQDFSTERDRSCSTDPGKKSNYFPKTPNSNKLPLASPNCGKRLEDAPAKFPIYEFSDQPSARKRTGGPLQSGNMEKCLEPPKKKQLRKERSLGGSFKDLTSNRRNQVPSFAFDPAETSSSHDKSVPSLKESKFSSPRKHISVNKTHLLESTKNAGKNSSSGKRSKEVDTLGSDNVGDQDTLTGLVIRKKRSSFGLASPSECNRKDSSLRGGGDSADLSSDMECGREGNTVSGPSSGVDVGDIANKSYDTDFHKMTSPSNYTSGSSDAYKKRSLCGTETTLCPINRSFHDDQMFGEDEAGLEMDSRDVQRDFFAGVDTIPIPGPPGSFLPSPRNMGSEDVQGNSSLTMSIVQSSEDHQTLIDGDSSGSPISAKSTISNSKYAESSSAAKSTISNSKYAESSSAGYSANQGEIRPGLPSTGKSPKPLLQEEETTTMVNFPERMQASFRIDQPCCCSRKEGFLNFQESQLLRRRTMGSVQVPTSRSSTLPEGFSSGSYLDKNVAPASKPTPKESADSALKIASFGGSDSASPSGSNPVLRLMGKNLMVVNKDENVMPAPVPSNNFLDQRRSQTPVLFPGTTGNASPDAISNQNHYNTFSTHFNPRPLQTSSAHNPGMNNFRGLPGPGFEQHEYGHPQMRYRNLQSYPLPHNVMNPMKEIIIIDDEPETEASRGVGMSNNRSVAGGFSGGPTAANTHPCYVSPFYSFRPHDSSSYFQVPSQSRAGGSPNIKWNRSPGGSLAAPPPPPLSSRMRPPLYYTPNFS